MKNQPDIGEYIRALIGSEQLGPFVVHHETLPEGPEKLSEPSEPWPEEISRVISAAGIQGLYTHQARAIDQIRSGRHVVAATPTASGKSLIYNLPLLEMVSKNPNKTALYLSPLKALAQDQLRSLKAMIENAGGIKADAAIYDGDTSAWNRKKIRAAPPNAIMTNPEMMHLSLLAHHTKWKSFFTNLGMVIVDEVHTYRGIFGSHMAQVFRRFQRICALYGAAPAHVFCSATIAAPAALARPLTALKATPVLESGAP
ncbi:MAG: DEAD/DEAH box helicase, partial [Desulfobacterales bacterium]|nr:DEAD/DEAH box helicase [Desulfobacterales bacterium]